VERRTNLNQRYGKGDSYTYVVYFHIFLGTPKTHIFFKLYY